MTVAHGRKETARGGFCGAVRGTTSLSSCAPPTATGTPHLSGTISSVSVLPGPLEL